MRLPRTKSLMEELGRIDRREHGGGLISFRFPGLEVAIETAIHSKRLLRDRADDPKVERPWSRARRCDWSLRASACMPDVLVRLHFENHPCDSAVSIFAKKYLPVETRKARREFHFTNRV
jgi:hypothetical protein